MGVGAAGGGSGIRGASEGGLQSQRAPLFQIAGDLVRRLHLEAHVDQPVATYSGGTKRKLSTALALLGKPDLLLLVRSGWHAGGTCPLPLGRTRNRSAVSEGTRAFARLHVPRTIQCHCGCCH